MGTAARFVYFAFGFPERAVVATQWLHGGGPDRCVKSSDRVRCSNATPGRGISAAPPPAVIALPLHDRRCPPHRAKASQAGVAIFRSAAPIGPRRFIVLLTQAPGPRVGPLQGDVRSVAI